MHFATSNINSRVQKRQYFIACIYSHLYTEQHELTVIKSILSLHFNCSHRLSHTVCEIYRPIVYEVYHNYYTAGKNHRNTVIPITIISFTTI